LEGSGACENGFRRLPDFSLGSMKNWFLLSPYQKSRRP